MKFEITQKPDFALLTVKLESGEKVYAEPSVMVSMDSNIQLKAGLKGGLGKALGRGLAGESLIINTFTAAGAPGEVTFAPGPMGDLVHYKLDGGKLMLQRGCYVANTDGVDVSAKWGGAKGFFGGAGLIMLQASGKGDVFFNTFGALIEIDVNGDYYVDTGFIVAFEDTLQYKVTTLPGLNMKSKFKSLLFGGEGLVCRFSGQGKLWVQTRATSPFLNFVQPFRPVKSKN